MNERYRFSYRTFWPWVIGVGIVATALFVGSGWIGGFTP